MERKAAYLQITRECNNKCVFCSNPQFEKDNSLDELKRIVLELKSQGITEIILTGGEPTIMAGISELIEFILSEGMQPRMITNGVRFSDLSLVKKLYLAGLKEIHVSMHSIDEAIGDELSKVKGNSKKTIEGINNAISCGFIVTINTTINSLNCNRLLENASFIIKNFPQIKHFVFNNLDPGSADGNTQSRAGENPWIVAKFSSFELELSMTLDLLKKNAKTFRVERVPLCYMSGFEEFSTETRKIVKEEKYICSFMEKDQEHTMRTVSPQEMRVKVGNCKICGLGRICAGIQKEYLDIHGDSEIYPSFIDHNSIIKKISPLKKAETKQFNKHDVLHLSITDRCNNSCVFCMDGCVNEKNSHDNIIDALTGFKNIGKVSFTGGEPTLNGNLLQYIRLAKTLGYEHISLISNGILLSNQEFLEALLAAGLNKIIVSLHSHNGRASEEIAHSDQDFQKAFNSLKLLSALKQFHDFEIQINFVITKKNYGVMNEFFHQVKDLRIDMINFNNLTLTGNALKNIDGLLIDYTSVYGKYHELLNNSEFKQSKIKISISGMPFCINKDSGNYDSVIAVHNRKISAAIPSENRIKFEFCDDCVYSVQCSGVQKKYVESFGMSEFHPLKNLGGTSLDRKDK